MLKFSTDYFIKNKLLSENRLPEDVSPTTSKSGVKCTKAKILKIRDETHDTKTFKLKPESEIAFKPGQSFIVGTEIDNRLVTRAYSVSSSPLKDYLEITVKLHPDGIFSNALFKRNVNEKISLEGPYGEFIFEDNSCRKLVLIGAGSGVAPLRGILHYILDKKLDIERSLFFYYKTEEDIIYRDELERLKDQDLDINICLTRSRVSWHGLKGRINKAHLKSVLEGTNNHLFYICGPLYFVKEAESILNNNGIETDFIRQEIFD